MVKDERYVAVFPHPEVVHTLQIIEIISVCVLLLFATYYIRLLARKQFCHANLRVMLIIQPLAHCGALSLRVLRHIIDYNHGLNAKVLNWLGGFQDGCLVICTVIMLPMAVERSIAMYFVQSYEDIQITFPTIGALSIGITVVYAIISNIAWYTDFVSRDVIYTILAIIFVSATIVFCYLPVACRKAYRKVQQSRNATMALRFQTGRNLRAARMLVLVAPYKCITNILSLIFYIIVYEKAPRELIPKYSEFYWYFNVLQAFFQMLLIMCSHSALKDELLYSLGCKRWADPNSIKGQQEVLSIVGEKMIFQTVDHSNIYFETYASSWQSGSSLINNNTENKKKKLDKGDRKSKYKKKNSTQNSVSPV